MICKEHDEASLFKHQHSLLSVCSNNIDNDDYDVCKPELDSQEARIETIERHDSFVRVCAAIIIR